MIMWNCADKLVVQEIPNHGLKDLHDKRNCESLVDFEDNENEYVVPTSC